VKFGGSYQHLREPHSSNLRHKRLLYTEDGSSIFLRNFGIYIANYVVLQFLTVVILILIEVFCLIMGYDIDLLQMQFIFYKAD
jgi:hypothetical protein